MKAADLKQHAARSKQLTQHNDVPAHAANWRAVHVRPLQRKKDKIDQPYSMGLGPEGSGQNIKCCAPAIAEHLQEPEQSHAQGHTYNSSPATEEERSPIQ
jgi:hypothetical protein